MLINLRNALMAGKRLPYDAEVEFLESTGTQYINTGIKVYDDTNVEITVKVNTQSEVAFIGSATSTDRFVIRSYSGSLSYGFGVWWTNTAATLYNQWRTLRTDVSVPTVYCDGTSYPATNTPSAKSGTDSILIFDSFRANRGDVAVAGVKIWRGSTLVFDAIPVRKGTVGYLYDRVSGKLFGNAGTGDFVFGQDVVPVEYIESNGKEWIDTGLTFDVSSVVDIALGITPTATTVGDAFFYGMENLSAGNIGLELYRTDFYIAAGSKEQNLGAATIGARYDFLAHYESGNSWIKTNGTTTATLTNAFTKISSRPMYLFSRYVSPATNTSKAKIYSFKVYKNNALARDFIPVRVGTEGAMMDTLTRRIYRNAGTGAFGYGNDLPYPIPA